MASGNTGRSTGTRSSQQGRGGRGGSSRPGGQRGGPSRGRNPVGRARKPQVRQRQVPWLLIGAIGVIVVLVAVLAFSLITRSNANSARDSALAPWRPTAENKDPSARIPGVDIKTYEGAEHVQAPTRVRYDSTPPKGGPHDQYWAACTGVVYDRPVRSENMVHSMEHGAVWVAYDPARVSGPALDTLRSKVQGVQYSMLSPFPGLDRPVSMQSWGHQLKVDDAGDQRVDQFLTAVRQNPNTHPEVGASCDALGPGAFDPTDPPAFQSGPFPPLGRGSVDMNYKSPAGAANERMGG